MVRIEIGTVVCTGECRKGSNFVSKIQTFLRERASLEARDQHQKLCLIQHSMRYTVAMQGLTSISMPLQESSRLRLICSLPLCRLIEHTVVRWWIGMRSCGADNMV